jgi:hypothetical protein
MQDAGSIAHEWPWRSGKPSRATSPVRCVEGGDATFAALERSTSMHRHTLFDTLAERARVAMSRAPR